LQEKADANQEKEDANLGETERERIAFREKIDAETKAIQGITEPMPI
jgi:hypothetical protein